MAAKPEMFTDVATVRLGEVSVKVRRLTIKEIREAGLSFKGGKECLGDECERLIKDHVTLADGSDFDPSQLSMRQMQRLVTELVGVPEGGGISDFIGLLS